MRTLKETLNDCSIIFEQGSKQTLRDGYLPMIEYYNADVLNWSCRNSLLFERVGQRVVFSTSGNRITNCLSFKPK